MTEISNNENRQEDQAKALKTAFPVMFFLI